MPAADLLSLLANKRMVIIDTAGLGQRDQRIQDMLDVLNLPSIKKVLVLNALWFGRTHPTHFNVEEAVEVAAARPADVPAIAGGQWWDLDRLDAAALPTAMAKVVRHALGQLS